MRGLAVSRTAALAGSAMIVASAVLAQAPAPGAWRTMAPMPDRRTEVSVTTDGTRIFVLGGFALSTIGTTVAPLPVFAYDPAADAWSHLTDLPEGVNHAGLVHLDGALYVVGGYRGTSFEPTDRVMVFDLASGAWRDGSRLSGPRGALAVTVLDGRIHAIGGTTAGGADTGAHEIFDPATGTWSRAEDLPTPRNHLAAATVNGEIVVLGGRDDRTLELTANEIWSPATNSWRSGAPVPTGRSGIAAVELDGLVYLFGGEVPDRTFGDAERYDLAADAWATLPPMPTPRHGLGAAALGGFIYVISGGPRPNLTFSDINERLDPG